MTLFTPDSEGEKLSLHLDGILAKQNAPYWFVVIKDEVTHEIVVWNHRVGETNKVTGQKIGKDEVQGYFRGVVEMGRYKNPVKIEVSGVLLTLRLLR